MTEARDLIAALDADEASGEAIITLWRPFRSQKIATRLDRFSDWRHYVRIGSRGERRHYLTARSADYPRQLLFELAMAKPVPQGLARLAPEAAKDFERATRQSR